MASRRMFSTRIINSARFLKMPVSTQCLYFHLGLHADDDGVVEAYTVMNSIGATEDDLKVLVSKGFVVVLNEDLVTYITDWNENNRLRADRKIDSIYKDLLLQVVPDVNLLEKKQRSDTKKIDSGQPMDNQWTDNGRSMDGPWTDNGRHRLGKDRIGEDRIGKDNIGEVNYTGIKDAYNTICVSFPKVTSLSDARKKTIRARLNTYSETEIIEAFRKAEASDFLKGKNNRDWRANFDWIMKDSNLAKVLDGNYDNRKSSASSSGISYCESEPDPEMDEFIRSIGGNGNG